MMLHMKFIPIHHVYPKTVFLTLTLLLAGCQSIWPEYSRPALDLPGQYTESADLNSNDNSTGISKTWWTLYQDPILNDLVNKALLNNTDIKLAVGRIEEADALLREVGAALLPQIELNAAATRSRVTEAGAFPVFSGNPRNNYIAQLGTSFEIDFWGKLRRAKDSARAQALSTRYAKDTVALSLTSLVTSNYLLLRSIESQITITQDNLKSRNASLSLTKRRLDGGVASALDVRQAEVASASLEAQLAELNRLRALNLHELALLAGTLDLNLAKTTIATLPIPPTPPAGLPSKLLESRPDIYQAEARMIL